MFWEVYALDRQEYLKSLTEQIRTKRARTMVAEEVEAHIEDQKQDFMAHGLGEEEAESMAVVEMGDPVEAGVKLDRVHRPKMEWTVLMAILVISIMGLILQAVVTSSFPTMNMSTLEALANRIIVLGQSPSNVIYDCKIPDEKRATRENQFENIEVLKLRNELIKQINQDVMSHA